MADDERPNENETTAEQSAVPVSALDLTDEHRAHLRTSGLTDETLALAHVHSLRKPAEIATALGYPRWRQGGGAIAFPVYVPGRTEAVCARVRPDVPRIDKARGRAIKYDQKPIAKGGPGIVVYFPPRTLRERLSGEAPVIWTEGEKKALLLDQLGYCVVGLTGVDNFHDKGAKDRGDGLKLHPWIAEHVSIAGRVHFVCHDSDARNKDGVLFAARRLAGLLKAAGAFDVRFVDIPDQGAEKFGVDDFHQKFGEQATRALFETTRSIDAIAPELPLMPVRDIAAFREAPEAISKTLRVPDGYEINRDGSLWELADGEGAPKRIASAAPIVTCVLTDDERLERLEIVARGSSGRWRTITVPRGTVVAGGIRSIELLGNLGLDVMPRADVGSWLAAFERTNGGRLVRAALTTRAGWHGEGEDRVFLLGTTAIDTEGKPTTRVRFDEGGSIDLARSFRTGGEAEEHVRLVRTAIGASDVAAASVFAALATPLLKPLGVAPFGFHLWGKSSRGKTTALQLSAGIYGSPQTHGEGSAIASWDGTIRGLELYAQTCSDLPVCLDESSTEKDREKRERAIYQVINGRGGLASKRDGTGLRSQRAWRTILISTGEQAIADARTRTGAQVRTIQVYVGGLGKLDAAGVDALKLGATKHYGHIGQRWIEALVRLDAESWANARARYEEILIELRGKCAANSLAARQTSFFALLVLAERMAARLIGIGTIEGSQMMRFAGAEDARLGVVPEEVRAAEVLLDWIAAEPGAFPPLRPSASEGDGTASLQELRERDAGGRGFAGFRGTFKGARALFLIDTPVEHRFADHGLDLRAVAREWVRIGVAMAQGPHHKPKVRIDGESARRWTLDLTRLEALCEASEAAGGPRNDGPGSDGKTGRGSQNLENGGGASGDNDAAKGSTSAVPTLQWGQIAIPEPLEPLGKNRASPLAPLFSHTPPLMAGSNPSEIDGLAPGTVTRAHAGVHEKSGASGDNLSNDRESFNKSWPHSWPQSGPTGDTHSDEDPDVWNPERCAAEVA